MCVVMEISPKDNVVFILAGRNKDLSQMKNRCHRKKNNREQRHYGSRISKIEEEVKKISDFELKYPRFVIITITVIIVIIKI